MPVCSEQRMNVWVARFIPLMLAGVVVYSLYVVVVLLCVNHLLNPPETSGYTTRNGPAIAILVLYFTLLFPMTISYCRLLYTIVANPGFVPKGPLWYEQEEERAHSGQTSQRSRYASAYSDSEKAHATPSTLSKLKHYRSKDAVPDLTAFYNKEVYGCKEDGRPPWCTHCMQWKPERVHHSAQVGRCVFKFDHFCPWVGGIIGETTFKFFTQFLFYASLFCAFLLIVLAIFIAEGRRKGDDLNVPWVVILALAAFFLFFSGGMAISSIYFVLKNLTTVENLGRKVAIWNFAVRLPASAQGIPPRPDNAGSQDVPSVGVANESQSDLEHGPCSLAPINPADPPPIAVLKTEKGENPWDLGPWENWRSIMGSRVIDWLLPVKYSPSCDHNGTECAYPLGPVVRRLRQQHGLPSHTPIAASSSRDQLSEKAPE